MKNKTLTPDPMHPLETVAKAIRVRREDIATRQGYGRYLCSLLIIAAVIYLAVSQVFFILIFHGTDMYPAILDGDILVGYRLDKDYVKNDVIIGFHDDRLIVGRVVAKAGDSVVITDDGILFVNGTAQTGEIAFLTMPGNQDYPFTVPDGCVFILGDYRSNTVDSRDYGPVPVEEIQATVVNVFRRRGI